MKQIRGHELKKVHIGQMVLSVTGPGDRPKPGLASQHGVVVGIRENRWGIELEIEWDNQTAIDTTKTLRDPNEVSGIGVYAYPNLEVAIS